MKKFRLILALGALAAFARPAAAQISIDEVNAQQENVTFRDRLKSTSVDVDYFSLARYKAERAAIRKERNYLEIKADLQGTLTSYNDPWISVSGGDNSIALQAVLYLKHTFKKNLFSLETVFNAKMGYNRMRVETTLDDGTTESNGVWFKNQDEFDISVAPAFKMAKNWSYGSIFKFRSQFVNGYVSRTEQERRHLKSTFMTPGYLDLSFGLTYNCPVKRFPIVVNLSPLSLNATFAESDWIRRQQFDADGNEIKPAYAYGIEDPDKTSKYEGGSSIQIDFDRYFGKTNYMHYKTRVSAFYGWMSNLGMKNRIDDYTEYRHAYEAWLAGDQNVKDKPRLAIHPTVRWENTLELYATKYIKTTVNFQLYYNRAQNLDVQTFTQLTVGLTYTFKNK